MELQHERSNLPQPPQPPASRNFSSSSSAFMSAVQTPFFSPSSPGHLCSELISSDIANAVHLRRLSTVDATSDAAPSDTSPLLNLCTSTSFGPPGIVYDNPSFAVGRSAGSSSNNNHPVTHNSHSSRRDKPRRFVISPGNRQSVSRPSSSAAPSTGARRSYDVYIGFHGSKPSLLRFTSWLRAELGAHGISCFACDRACCRSPRDHHAVERIMDTTAFGIVVITRRSFGNPYSIEELKNFHRKRNLVPIFFDVSAVDCLARDIIEMRGELWEKHGGELWLQYGGIEQEWREAVDALLRAADDPRLELNDGNWRDTVMHAVVKLAMKLGRRSVVDRVNRWRERLAERELPFQRNECFVGRKKELSELELALFGDIAGDGKRQFIEIKTARHRRSGLAEEGGTKGKAPFVWKETDKEIEMQRNGVTRVKNGRRYGRKRGAKVTLTGKGIAVVSGECGIGKTELVLEYAYRFAQRYKTVLWVGGESRYVRQNYLALRSLLEVDLGASGGHSHDKVSDVYSDDQEEVSVAQIRRELICDIPYLVVIDNLESEKDWWDKKLVADLLPRLGSQTHLIITTRLPRVMNMEPMMLSYMSGVEAMALMKGSVRDYPAVEVDALKLIEDRLGRLTLGLGIVGSVLSELPISPSRLLDAVNRTQPREFTLSERETLNLKRHEFFVRLVDVCLSIFDHIDGPRSLATRMVQASGWFAPAAIPVRLLAMAAHKARRRGRRALLWRQLWNTLAFGFTRYRVKRSESEAASMLTRFGIARLGTTANSLQFHELIRLYSRKRGGLRSAQAVVQAVYLRGSISHSVEHIWAACFLVLGFSSDPVAVELRPTELLFFLKQIVLPLAVHTFVAYSRCSAALELLRLATESLELAADSLLSSADKWRRKAFLCYRPAQSEARFTCLWQELALLKATLLETRAKLMLRAGQYDRGDDLVRKAIFIRSSICGERHPDTLAAREMLSKLTRLLMNAPS